MPKGDYQRLKADIEDGIVPIAHLLLEALSMAKLNGVAKGIVLFIWRRTYGWAEEGAKKHKDDRITLAEFAQAVESERTYVSTQLKILVRAKVIYEMQDVENGRYKRYGMNTDVATWSTDVIDVDSLAEAVHEKLYVHSSRKVTQTHNRLANTKPFVNAKPLCDNTTKPLCKSTTVVSDNLLSSADSEGSKESNEINKKIADADIPPISPIDEMTIDKFEEEVEWRMRERMGNERYILKLNDRKLLHEMLAYGVSRQTILDGIDKGFQRYVKKTDWDPGIKNFVYFRDIVFELHEAIQSRTEAAVALRSGELKVTVRGSSTRAGPNQKANVRDERYAAFYELFPDT